MTNTIQAKVADYMTKHLHQIQEQASLGEALALLDLYQISSLAVTAGDSLRGVISRTDLLREMQKSDAWSTLRVSSQMSSPALVTSPEETLSNAAGQLVSRRIHRLYVVEGGRPVGVLSTKDLMRAIQRERVETPISRLMTSPVISVEIKESLEVANQRLLSSGVHGLAVVDDDWPVGIYTQFEALQAKGLPPQTPVEDAMSYALFCLSVDTPLYRAAAYSAQNGIRRILAVEHRKARGVLTDFDMARAIAP
jgi:predicted transcriptional regulator